MIFRVCLIIIDAICVAATDDEIVKALGVIAITLMSVSFLGMQKMKMTMTLDDEREMRANGITNIEINHIKQLYEARLKADMIAMLTEIKLEIKELKSYESADGQDLVMLADIGVLLNQKINKLREGEL